MNIVNETDCKSNHEKNKTNKQTNLSKMLNLKKKKKTLKAISLYDHELSCLTNYTIPVYQGGTAPLTLKSTRFFFGAISTLSIFRKIMQGTQKWH